MAKKNLRRRTFGQLSCKQFVRLEPRQMLTTLFTGTNAADSASIEYVADHLVNVRINDTLHENVDSTAGIRINLGNSVRPTLTGNDVLIHSQPASSDYLRWDQVFIDHRISDEIEVYNVGEVILDGGDNAFQISSNIRGNNAESNLSFSYFSVGLINENITVTHFQEITSGDGNDTFNVDTHLLTNLSINAGGGDDLFRFASNADQNDLFSFNQAIVANGDQGNDRFIYLPRINRRIQAFGGEGTDVVDSRYSETGFSIYVQRELDSNSLSPALGVETYIGASDQSNRVELRSDTTGERFEWKVNGDTTTIEGELTDEVFRFENFNRFRGSTKGVDWFYVHETGRNVDIVDADEIRISSNEDPRLGNLNGIRHDVSIFRIGDHIQSLPPSVFGYSVPVVRDVDGVSANPVVVISNMAGSGIHTALAENQEVKLDTGGIIRFHDKQKSIPSIVLKQETLTPFQPTIIVHGSNDGDDVFLVNETWTPTTIYSHGGDDLFFVGASNRDANGNLETVSGELTIGAGTGMDRLYFNNQSFNAADAHYTLNQIGFSLFSNGDLISAVTFNSAIEVARVNGAIAHANHFLVFATESMRFVLTGSSDTSVEDTLVVRLSESMPDPQLVFENDDPTAGFVTASLDPIRPIVFFESVEDATLFDSTKVRYNVNLT